MNSNYKFINEKFIINKNIYITVDTTVIEGNRICKLKSLKINYKGQIYEMECGKNIYKFIIQDGIRSISSIEIINYLNKFLNKDNLYEIYELTDETELEESKNDKSCSATRCKPDAVAPAPTSEVCSELKNLILHKNNYNPNRYKPNLIQHNRFIKTELEKYRNSKYPICYKSFNEIKTIPVYCYVHPSLAINQKETIILCHLGYILEKLASYKSMPEFNTQAMISFLNITNRAKMDGLNVEDLNEYELRYEIKRLQCKNSKLLAKIDILSSQIKNLSNQVQSQTEKMDSDSKMIKSQIETIKSQSSLIVEQTQSIQQFQNKLVSCENKLESSLGVMQELITSQIQTSNLIRESNRKQIETITKLIPPEVIGMKQTHEIILFIYSPSLNQKIKDEIPDLKIDEDEIILDTISCQLEDLQKHLRYHQFDKNEDEIILKKELSNALDINKFIKNYSTVAKILNTKGKYVRKYTIHSSEKDIFIKEFNEYVNKIQEKHNEMIESLNISSVTLGKTTEKFDSLIQNYIKNEFDDPENISNDLILGRINYLTNMVKDIKTEQSNTNLRIQNIEKSVNNLSDKLKKYR